MKKTSKRRLGLLLLLALALALFSGCAEQLMDALPEETALPGGGLEVVTPAPAAQETAGAEEAEEAPEAGEAAAEAPEPRTAEDAEKPASEDSAPHTEAADPAGQVDTPEPEPVAVLPEPEETPEGVTEEGEYSSPEEVAEYLHRFGHLPSNFITKSQAQALGWDSRAGNLWDAAPGKSIGGDSFGNREGLLPKGRYRECDVNYSGGYRGSERLIYGEDGSIWYTSDHYESFTQLY